MPHRHRDHPSPGSGDDIPTVRGRRSRRTLARLAGAALASCAPLAAPASASVDFVSRFGTVGSNPGQFNNPYAVAVDPATHDVYVLDTTNGNVQRFHADGTLVGRPPRPRPTG